MSFTFVKYVGNRNHFNATFYVLCAVILIATHNTTSLGDESENNVLVGDNMLVIDPDLLPEVIEWRIYFDYIIAETRGKNLYDHIVSGGGSDKADQVRSMISLNEEQTIEINVNINMRLADSKYIEILNQLREFPHIVDAIKDQEKFALLSPEEQRNTENLLVELYRSEKLLRNDALKSVLHPSQIRTIREFLLASPPSIILLPPCDTAAGIEIALDEIEFKEVEIINFDCYEALDLSDKQRDQIKVIQEKFEKDLFVLLRSTFDIAENDRQNEAVKSRSSLDIAREIEDHVQQTKGLILEILTSGQKSRLALVQRMFACPTCVCPVVPKNPVEKDEEM